ncbi:hypothetical protein QQZ08_009700 [Neonectria magnoliae]|uniref:Fluoride ion transporter CrcB n=1 Tax=Neonectria magnoliae TaxID=2732573 RepID=A0ABR1HLX3_9HYPO
MANFVAAAVTVSIAGLLSFAYDRVIRLDGYGWESVLGSFSFIFGTFIGYAALSSSSIGAVFLRTWASGLVFFLGLNAGILLCQSFFRRMRGGGIPKH